LRTRRDPREPRRTACAAAQPHSQAERSPPFAINCDDVTSPSGPHYYNGLPRAIWNPQIGQAKPCMFLQGRRNDRSRPRRGDPDVPFNGRRAVRQPGCLRARCSQSVSTPWQVMRPIRLERSWRPTSCDGVSPPIASDRGLRQICSNPRRIAITTAWARSFA